MGDDEGPATVLDDVANPESPDVLVKERRLSALTGVDSNVVADSHHSEVYR